MSRRIRFTPFVRTGVFALAVGAAAVSQAGEVPFAPPLPVYAPAGAVERWAPADFDGDADLDLLVAAPLEGRLLLLRNLNGAGTAWSPVTVATSVSGEADAVAADIDGDGDLDALATSPSSPMLTWHENLNGAGTAWTIHTIATGGSFGLEAADIDRDGDLDVVALPTLPAGSPLRWFQNGDGGASWTAHTIGAVLVDEPDIDAVDLDRDGDLDLLTTTGAQITWFENSNGGTSWTAHTVALTAEAPTGTAAADFDRDGDPDVVGLSAWFENTSGGSWPPHFFALGPPVGPSLPTPADVDGDGDVDIWAHEESTTGAVVWYDNLTGDGRTWTRRVVATASSPSIATPIDVDGDGDLDGLSASGNPARIVLHRNDTIHRDACFGPSQTVFDLTQARSILPADVDRDGDLDVLTSHLSSSVVFWHENAAGGSAWTPHTVTTIGVAASSLAVGDLDRDGDTDVAGDFRQGSTLIGKHWLENAGDGSSFTQHTISTLTNFYGAELHVADIDGDGDPDVFEAMSAGYVGPTSRWFANGGAGMTWSSPISAPGNRGHLADFDRDGDLDVVASADSVFGSDAQVFWLQNVNGAGSVWNTRLIAQPADARTSAPADLDGDGHIDVISSQFVNQEWYRNLGSGTSWSGAGPIPGGGYKARPYDLDEDGDVDLLRLHTSPPGTWRFGWNENLQGNGQSWLPHTLPGTPDTASFTPLAAADLDQDGDLDVVTGEASVKWHPNHGGQYALAAENTAPGTVQQGNLVSMLRVIATHLGRAGDGPLELARFGVLLEEAAGDPLTSGEANLLVESLRVYRDVNGNGIFEPTDALVASIGTLSLADGVQDVPFTDGDPNVAVAFGTPQTFFLVVELTADAAIQSPNRVRTTLLQLGPSASQAEHAAYDLALAPACPADVSSVVTVAVVPVELMGFTIE